MNILQQMFFNWFLIFFDNWSPLANLSSNDWIDGMNSNANSPTWNCFRTGTKKNKEHELVPSITRPFSPILELSNGLEIDHERRGVSVRMHRDPMGSIFFGTRLKLETSSSFTSLKPNMLVPEMKSFLNIRWKRINY